MAEYQIESGAIYADNSVGFSWVVEAFPRQGDIVDQYAQAWEEFGQERGLSIGDIEERFLSEMNGYGEWHGEADVDLLWEYNTYNDGNLDIGNKLIKVTRLELDGDVLVVMAIGHNFSDPRGSYSNWTLHEVRGSRREVDEETAMWAWIEDFEPYYSFSLNFIDGSTINGHADGRSDSYHFVVDDKPESGSMAYDFYHEHGSDLDYAVDRILTYGELD